MKKSTVLIVLMHLAYWALPISRIFTLFNTGGGPDFDNIYFNYCFAMALGLVVFYTVYFFIFPNFIQKRAPITTATNWKLFLIAVLGGLGLPMLLAALNTYKVGGYNVYRVNTANVLIYLFSFTVSAIIIRGFATWALEIKYKEQLEKSNLESNLALLKARINPHFLFNTLNNIDVLIEKDAVVASTYLKKLSDILRFTLYESPSATIPLSKEADYIKQYIELQQIRTSNADFVKFSFEQNTDNLQIAPMLFIPFIENAFKYCTNKKIKNAVVISISTAKNEVVFSCSNAYDADIMITHEESGLGLDLIKSRLELLYPKNYQLDINKTTDRFTVNLTITLV